MNIFKERDEQPKSLEPPEPHFVPVDPVPRLNLPDIRELKCVKLSNRNDYYLFLCEPVSKRHMSCPSCGSNDYYAHGHTQDRTVHDINMGHVRVELKLKTPRYYCNQCHITFAHEFDSVMKNQQFTKRLYSYIMNRAIDTPFASLAYDYGVSIPKIAKIFKEGAVYELADYKVIAPRVLGIDEKHIVHTMRGVFVDIENGRLLEMTKNNKATTMIEAIKSFEGYETNIKIVTIDMSCGYYSMIQTLLPQAKVVINKYHVIQDLGRCVNVAKKAILTCLKKEIAQIPDETTRKEKEKLLANAAKNTYMFKYREESMPQKTLSCLVEACEAFPMLNQLRLIKSAFHRMYDCNYRDDAMKQYVQWISLIPKEPEFDEIWKFRNTVKRWYYPIFNYFDPSCGYTNAATEGLNSLIDIINKNGRGYSFEVLRYKCLMHSKAQDKPRLRRQDIPKYDFDSNISSYISYGNFVDDPDWQYDSDADAYFFEGADIDILLELLRSQRNTFL